MHKKVFSILGGVFFGIGMLLLVVAAGFGVFRWNVIANSDRVTGTIIDIVDRGDSRQVTVRYEVGGEEIIRRLNWWSSDMRTGQPIELLVRRYYPHRISSPGIIGWLPVLIIGPQAVVFGGIGAGFLLYNKRKKNLRRWLLENGNPIMADVLGTEDNWSMTVNGRPATVLVATYNNMRFVSGPLCNNDLMNLGEQVKILLHPDDANKYIFDFNNESGQNSAFSGW